MKENKQNMTIKLKLSVHRFSNNVEKSSVVVCKVLCLLKEQKIDQILPSEIEMTARIKMKIFANMIHRQRTNERITGT